MSMFFHRPTVAGQKATCPCGRTYYTDEGGQCPLCDQSVQAPFLLRDQCGTCGTPCSADWCPYCEGCHDSEEEANTSRRATEFAVKQQDMLAAQLEARDKETYELKREIVRLNTALNTARGDAKRFGALFEGASRATQDMAKEVYRLRTQHEAVRKTAVRALRGACTLAALGAVSWACWDRLPGWSPEAIERWKTLVGFAVGAFGTHLWLKHAKLPGRTPFGNPDDPHAEPTELGFPPGDASP